MLEQSEYNDRVKVYNQRLAQQWNTIPIPELSYNGLLKDIANPESQLFFNPTIEEIAIVRQAEELLRTEINSCFSHRPKTLLKRQLWRLAR
jgi:hypothetical protein